MLVAAKAIRRLSPKIAGFGRGWSRNWRSAFSFFRGAAGRYQSLNQNSIALALKNSLFAHAVKAGLVAVNR
jgi:hypothetical protein